MVGFATTCDIEGTDIPEVATIVSVDDHLIEPEDTFVGRLPGRFADRQPRLVQVDASELASALRGTKWDPATNPKIAGSREADSPRDAWLIDGQLHQLHGMESCMGRPSSDWGMVPLRFDEMRAGSWDVDQRVADMDLNGVYASLNFPSMWVGFCGTTFLRQADPEFGAALVRAWNAWHLEGWCSRHPERFIPLQLPMLWDPEAAAEEIVRNADLGFKAVSFLENPTGQGLPSIHTSYWDRFFGACEETETVICLHIGSSGHTMETSPDAPIEAAQSLTPASTILTAVEWVWSRVAIRFPNLKIALSEGGIGWLPLVMDWMDHTTRTHNEWTHGWDGVDLLPSEILLRNFWFCSIDEPLGMRALSHTIRTDRVMLEVDYPHADSTWPDTRSYLDHLRRFLSPDEVQAITWKTACSLFRHPAPRWWGVHTDGD
jgi:predicted TIM-barrel fold metal-dependent hydrolase